MNEQSNVIDKGAQDDEPPNTNSSNIKKSPSVNLNGFGIHRGGCAMVLRQVLNGSGAGMGRGITLYCMGNNKFS